MNPTPRSSAPKPTRRKTRPTKPASGKPTEFESFAETTSAAIFITQGRGILYANSAAIRSTGYTREELLGMELWQIAHPNYQPAFKQLGGTHTWVEHIPSRYEIKIVTKTGEESWLDVTIGDIDYKGEAAIAVTAFDITERDRAERALRAAHAELEARVQERTVELAAVNARLQSVLGTIAEAYVALDSDWRFLTLNHAAEAKVFGRPTGELIGKVIWDEYPQTVGQEVYLQYQLVVETRQPVHFETPSRIVPGHWFEVHAYPHGGGLEAYFRDITERKKAEVEIASLAKFPSENPNPVLRLNSDGDVLYANKASQTLLHTWARTTGDAALADWRSLAARTAADQADTTVDLECGGRAYSFFITPIVEAGYVNFYGSDITERTQAEEALRESEEKYRRLIENIDDLVCEVDAQTRYQFVNSQYERILGYASEELLGHYVREIIHPDDLRQSTQSFRKLVDSGSVSRNEWRFKHKNGEWRWFDCVAQTYEKSPGEQRVVVISRDITDRKKKEAELNKLNRALRALSNINQTLMRVEDEARLLDEVCKIIVRDCGYPMVWIGFAEQDEVKTVRPVAYAGFEAGYLETLQVTWADTVRGQGPTGTAIRTGRPGGCSNMLTDPNFRPWRAEAIKRGYASSIVLPLIAADQAFGAVTIYSRTPDSFSEEEIELLTELAGDLVYGITTLRLRAAHAQSEEALRIAHNELELRVQERTKQLASANEELSDEIEERKEIERQLRLQTTAMEAAANGILITDRQGNIQWNNPAFTQMTGYAADEALGQNIRLLKSNQQSREFYRGLWETILAGSVWHGELINRRKDGSLYVEEQTIAPVLSEQGEIVNFISVKQDVTERRRAEARLQQNNRDLLALSKAERDLRLLAETLAAAHSALTQSLDLDDVLEALLDHVGRLVPYDSANVMLLEAESRLGVRVARGYERGGAAEVVRALKFDGQANPILNKLLTTRQSTLVPDTRAQPGWETSPGVEHVCSWLGVPLIAGGNVIGLYSLDKTEPGFFTVEHVRIAEMLAGQAAVAIQNAWLFEQVRAGRERLQSLSRRLVEVQEAERQYVARELHDEAGQALTSLLFGLGQLELQVIDASGQAAQIAELKQSTLDIMAGLHRLAVDLRPASLDQLGLIPVLLQLVKTTGERYSLIAQFKAMGLEGERLPSEVETALYRIVQEALTNIIRHARATRVDVLLERRGDRAVVVVEDNGLGFDAESDHSTQTEHLGLVGMRERAEMLGGSLIIESTAGIGTTVVAEVPYGNSYPGR